MKPFLNSLYVIAVLSLSIESLNAFRISGTISLGEGTGLSGVDVRISNRAGEPLQTDFNGDYTIDLPDLGKPHMVAPRKTGYTFEPAYFYIEELNQAETVNFIAKPVPSEPLDKKMIYYYINWGGYARDYNVRDIPVENITHINYAFLMPFVEAGTLQVGDNVAFRVGQTGKVITVSHTENHSVGLVLTDEFANAYDTYFSNQVDSVPAFTDLGTPYSWYEDFGLAIADESAFDLDTIDLMDSDGDGYANFKEYIFGTNPVDKTSAFKLSLRGSNQLNWEPVLSGRSYELQWTDNLINPFQTIEVFQSSTRNT